MSAHHPKADIFRSKKALSYIVRLCQPSFRLFELVDKGGRYPNGRMQPGRGTPGAFSPPRAQIGARIGLNFPDLWTICVIHDRISDPIRGSRKNAMAAPHPKADIGAAVDNPGHNPGISLWISC